MSLTRFVSKLLAALLLLTACSQSSDHSPVVASVYNRELHRDDLKGLVPQGLSAEDSLTVVRNYVEQWIRQSVILAKAEKNVKNDFSRELQEYKNNLLVYAYERQILDQLLDTMVSSKEIMEYYDMHKSDFTLKNAIVKVVYVTAPAKSPAVAKIKRIVSRDEFSASDVVDLEEAAALAGIKGYFDATSWIPFVTLQTAIPITAYNEQSYLSQHRTIAFNDDSLFYAARILDYKLADEISPLDVQRDNIRAIILNHRKIDILNKLQNDLLEEAEEGGHVKSELRVKNKNKQ